jgi:hypothetical protein
MEVIMKKYGLVMFSAMIMALFVLPLTTQAEEEKAGMEMKGHSESMEPMRKMHRDWLSSLNLEEKVIRNIQEIRLKYKEKNLELKSAIDKKDLEFERVLLDKKLNFDKLLSIHDEISVLRQKIARQMLEEKIEIYKLIPDDKKEEVKKMFLHKFRGQGHEEMHGGPMKK